MIGIPAYRSGMAHKVPVTIPEHAMAQTARNGR